MHREGALKNIFKEENWNELGKASTHMYTRKAEEEEFNPEEYEKQKHTKEEAEKAQGIFASSEKSQVQPSSQVDNAEMHVAVAKLKSEKDEEINMIVQKINDLISRQNRLETALEEKDAKINDLSHQIELYLKKPAPESLKVEKRAPVDTPIDRNNVAPSEVTIEKMFNFSNKKF